MDRGNLCFTRKLRNCHLTTHHTQETTLEVTISAGELVIVTNKGSRLSTTYLIGYFSSMYQNNYGVGGPNLYNNYYSPPPAFGHETAPSALSTINEAAAISILKHLNIQELEDLLNNDSKLQNLIDDLPQFKAVQREHDNLVVTTKSLAEYNLSFQPKIDALKRNLAGDYERANSLRTSLVERKAVLAQHSAYSESQTVIGLLKAFCLLRISELSLVS
ncbi:hypothetical protein Btru_054064 [Bulinus truncatus]|nr:hypothetical protein Btru_054064 [Bulinus truncatus]